MSKPPELAKDAATVLFAALDGDRDVRSCVLRRLWRCLNLLCGPQTYISADDIAAFIKARSLSIPLRVAGEMAAEARGPYTPEGKVSLLDMRQAAGSKKERVVVRAVPPSLCPGHARDPCSLLRYRRLMTLIQ